MTRQRKQNLCMKMVEREVQRCLMQRGIDPDNLKICFGIKIKEINRCHRKSKL